MSNAWLWAVMRMRMPWRLGMKRSSSWRNPGREYTERKTGCGSMMTYVGLLGSGHGVSSFGNFEIELTFEASAGGNAKGRCGSCQWRCR